MPTNKNENNILFIIISSIRLLSATDHTLIGENTSTCNLSQQDLSDIYKITNESVSSYNSNITGELKKFLVIDLKKNKYNRQHVSAIYEKGEKLVYVNCV
jgi:predicted GNAT superfamily acetyltransferase